mgnify:FL=1
MRTDCGKMKWSIHLMNVIPGKKDGSMENSETHEITIDRLAYGGDGFARLPDGRAVFVPLVIPGEKVTIRIVDDKQKYVRGELQHIIDPSPVRIEPPCPHFGVCGGCHYQHIPYAEQIKYKKTILQEQLQRIAHLDSIPDLDVFQSDEPFNYRNVMQFHLTGSGKLGFKKRSSDEVFELTRCLLSQAAIQQLWQNMSLEPQSGIERIEIRQNESGDVLVIMQGDEQGIIPEVELDFPVSLVHRVGDEMIVLSGEDNIQISVLDHPFRVSAGSFFQINAGLAGKMVTRLLSTLKQKAPHRVLDLYAGVGLFSHFMAPLVDELVAVEGSSFACQDFAANLNEYEHISLYQGSVENILPDLDVQAELVVCDPPRAGLHPRVIDALAASAVTSLVYISCDPATLARDLRRLIEKGFAIENIALFDLFPQTYHMEAVTLLERSEPSANYPHR